MLTLLPGEIEVAFRGGPWDGRVERGAIDATGPEATWIARVGGGAGEVVGHVYHLTRIQEFPDGRVRLTYSALE